MIVSWRWINVRPSLGPAQMVFFKLGDGRADFRFQLSLSFINHASTRSCYFEELSSE